MSDNEIKLTTTNNTTNNGTPFPSTPQPQVLMEYFASVELNNQNQIRTQTNSNNDSSK